MPGVSSRTSSSTGGTLEVPTLIATASGKKLALASPAARGGAELAKLNRLVRTLKRLPTPLRKV